ncbi:MAG TPA: glycogen-binding domain-containing protein [Gemmatimonadaceae bacterium]|nr:glycogen-binding domain-containing protein [Gemmatimonadaceae bacterium]
MRRQWLILTVGLALVAAAARADAQWELTGDFGVSHLQQTGIPTGSAGTAGLTFEAASARAWMQSSVLAARATQDRWTGQGLLAGTLIGPSAAAARWQFDALASSFAQSNSRPTASGELAARLRAGGPSFGAGLGAAAGATARAGSSSQTWRGLADGWMLSGAERFVASTALTSAPVLGVVAPSLPTPRVRYLDVAAGWRHEAGGLSIGASVGYRDGMGEVDDGSWATGDASVWVSSRAAVVLAAGTALPDVVRGTPRSTYVSAALRISGRPHTRIALTGRPAARIRVRLARGVDGAQRIEIVAPNASRVELRGDFTDWRPVLLERAGDVFQFAAPLSAGLHRVSLRVDDGDWIAPSNLPHADDGVGGTVGLITVP